MGLKREDKVYAKSFRFSQEGHALWPKVLSDDLKPGACGYVNGSGDWKTIIQLSDPKTTAEGFNGNVEIKLDDDGGMTGWTPKVSKKVTGAEVKLEGKALPPGSPATANAGVQYTCGMSTGAVLLARGEVTNQFIVTGEAAMKTWADKNLAALIGLGDFDSIEKRGLWVVTKIHYTGECAKTVMQEKNAKTSFHVGTTVPDIATATASAAWWNSETVSSGWVLHKATNKLAPGEEPPSKPAKLNRGVVMFFGGIWWKPGGLFSSKFKAEQEKEKQKYLDHDFHADPSTLVEVPGGNGYLKLSPRVLDTTAGSGGGGAGGWPTFDDSYEMYTEDDDSDSD